MVFFEKICRWLAVKMNQVGMTGIVFVMLLTCSDIWGRVFHEPILGVYELVAMVTGLAISFTIPYTILSRGNVVVTLIVNRFPPKYQNIIESITLLLSLLLFAVIAWETATGSITSKLAGEVSLTLGIPMYYLIGLMAFAFAIAYLVLLMNFVDTIKRVVAK
jgi:TRAP-type C4-dicarboxylate transport system permease small subunit